MSRATRGSSGSAALLVMVGAVVLSGCRDPLGAPGVPDEVATPSVVGIIDSSEQKPDGVQIELQNGGTVLLPIGAAELTGPVEDGRLLFYGAGGHPRKDGPWFSTIRSLPSGCFPVAANGEVHGDRLALSLGFSVPLSAGWPENETETRFVNSPTVGFCLNEAGEAVGTYANTRGQRADPSGNVGP